MPAATQTSQREQKPIDMLAIGEPMVEFNQRDPGQPSYLQGYGGDSSNMIIAAARSGARTAYFTRIGDDAFGRLFLALWAREGVDARHVIVDSHSHTAAYFVTHGPQGHEFGYLRAGSAASRMQLDELPTEALRGTRVVHASGISMAISTSAADTVLAAFEQARAAGASISFDLNLRLRLWPLARARAMVRAALDLSDYCFGSLDDLQLASGLDEQAAIIDWAHAAGPQEVFLKLGADGVIVSDGATRTHIRGHEVNAVDATGAGDCFCGAALARLLAGDTLLDATRYANAAAALATTGFGAVEPLPTQDAVHALLAATHAPARR